MKLVNLTYLVKLDKSGSEFQIYEDTLEEKDSVQMDSNDFRRQETASY